MEGFIVEVIREAPHGYTVEMDGTVYSTVLGARRKIMPTLSTHGYPRVRFVIDGKRRSAFVHKLVMGTFGSAPPFPGAQIRHLNGDQSDNRIENLAWGTAKDNCDDRARHGTTVRGHRIYNSKLTEEQVREIRQRVGDGEARTHLAREFGVSIKSLSYAASGRTWSHLRSSEQQRVTLTGGES